MSNNFEVFYGSTRKSERKNVGRTRTAKYPWETMADPTIDENGNPLYAQFFVPGQTRKQFASTVSAAVRRYDRNFYVSDVMTEDGVSGVLVEYHGPITGEQRAKREARAAKRAAKAA
jgi:hypothetical protein